MPNRSHWTIRKFSSFEEQRCQQVRDWQAVSGSERRKAVWKIQRRRSAVRDQSIDPLPGLEFTPCWENLQHSESEIIREDPFADPPPFEALVGDLKGAYSRRINIQHRLVYEVLQDEAIVKVLRLWTHDE